MKKTRHIGIWFLVPRSSSRVDLLKIKVIRRGFLQCIVLHYFGLLLYIKDSKKKSLYLLWEKRFFPFEKYRFWFFLLARRYWGRRHQLIEGSCLTEGQTGKICLSFFADTQKITDINKGRDIGKLNQASNVSFFSLRAKKEHFLTNN